MRQQGSKSIPDKLYYKIGEVARAAGVPAHVVRYWEQEFPQLAPVKTPSGHRLFRRRDIRLILEIKHLLHDLKFTTQGAREYLMDKQRQSERAGEEAGGRGTGRLERGLKRLQTLLSRTPPF
ncbi:MAG: MerR family transcriptional regulator [Acidobacteriota bacterium]|jgi:DNA-binding transcriptional MerR regulator